MSKASVAPAGDLGDPAEQTRRMIRLCVILGLSAAMAIPAAVLAISSASTKRVVVIGVDDRGGLIPAVSLDKPYLNDPRVQAFAEECLRLSFAHDFRNFRRTIGLAQECYTPAASDLYAQAMGPLLSDLEKRRMVMTAVIERPPVVSRTMLVRGVYTWEVQARVIINREGTTTRVPPASYNVLMRISRANLEDSIRGVLVSNIEMQPG